MLKQKNIFLNFLILNNLFKYIKTNYIIFIFLPFFFFKINELNNFLILQKFFFFKFFTLKKLKRQKLINLKEKFSFDKSKVLIWSKSKFNKKKNLYKTSVFKQWKYNFLKKNFFLKSNFFLKFLKKKIFFSQLLASRFFFSPKKNKQIKLFFNIFNSKVNNLLNLNFFLEKFYYQFLFKQKFKKFNFLYKNVFFYSIKKNIFIFNYLNNVYYFSLKKKKIKKFVMYFCASQPINTRKRVKKILKRNYWIKKNKFNYISPKNYSNFYNNYFLINKNNLTNLILINKSNNFYLIYYLNFLINVWNIKTYNWKQIT